jgi:hypothetical protein
MYIPIIEFELLKYILIYFTDHAHTCLKDRLTAFTADLENFNAHLQHEPLKPEEDSFVPYIGNGYFGLEVLPDGWLHIKNGRTLSLPFKCQPIVETRLDSERWEEVSVVHYLTGIKIGPLFRLFMCTHNSLLGQALPTDCSAPAAVYTQLTNFMLTERHLPF